MSDVLQNTQHVHKVIIELSKLGITKAVICPGSRSAAITETLVNSSVFQTVSCVDERSAGYLAMGMAQQEKSPVIVVCTSGTAAVNFYPALIESYYQGIPLLFMTADRPPQWIDQWDGQTIRQSGLYSNYIETVTIDAKDSDSMSQKVTGLSETLFSLTPGPAHLNVPIAEPFYGGSSPSLNQESRQSVLIKKPEVKDRDLETVISAIQNAERPVLIAGQGNYDPELREFLNQADFPVIADPCSNLHNLKNSLTQLDLFFSDSFSAYFPDLIISLGTSVVSKVCKQKLRATNLQQFHIGFLSPGDPFQKQPTPIFADTLTFLKAIPKGLITKDWQEQFRKCKEKIIDSLEKARDVSHNSHYDMIATILLKNSHPDVIHFGNSMAIRWAGLLSHLPSESEIHCNRGTSGIDGCLSTAVGHALASPQKTHWLFIGDLSFFYDRNGLWLPVLPENLKIIVLNDGGGGIFHVIKGPKREGELAQYFQTNHNRSAQNTADEFNLSYQQVNNLESLDSEIPVLTKNELCILELFAQMANNEKSYYSTINSVN